MLTARPSFLTCRLSPRWLIATATVAFTLAATPAANAQFGGRASFAEAFQPDILQRDLPLLLETLKLEEWQRPILEAMLSDYIGSFNTGLEGMKERMKAAAEAGHRDGQGGNPDMILSKVMEGWPAWRAEKRQLFEKFVADLQSQLGPQQRELWPTFERALRRERQLGDGMISGESTNLWTVIARMQLNPAEAQAIQPALAAYEEALDAALVNRMTRLEELEGELRDAMQQMDYDKGANVQDRIMTLRVAVRTTNDDGVEAIAAALGTRGDEFRKAALEAGYADAFRRHAVMTLVDQALLIETLTPEQRAEVQAIGAELQAASDEANLRFYEMLRVEEPKMPRRKVQQQMERRAAGGRPVQPSPQAANLSDPIIKMRMEREQLGEPYRQRIMAILSPEQSEGVPDAGKLDPAVGRLKDPELKSRPTAGDALTGSERPAGDPGRRRQQPRRDPRNPSGQPADSPDNKPAMPPADEPAQPSTGLDGTEPR